MVNSKKYVHFFISAVAHFLCYFHVVQAVGRFLTTKKNGCSQYKLHLLAHIRRIAMSVTFDEYEENVEIMKTSESWLKSKKFATYFVREWEVKKEVKLLTNNRQPGNN